MLTAGSAVGLNAVVVAVGDAGVTPSLQLCPSPMLPPSMVAVAVVRDVADVKSSPAVPLVATLLPMWWARGSAEPEPNMLWLVAAAVAPAAVGVTAVGLNKLRLKCCCCSAPEGGGFD